ncbi:MAG TPA: sugar kinase [Chitinophagaceae bacterium]
MQIQFLAIGELLADIISVDYCNDLSEARSFQLFQGGSPSNVAANLKWLGHRADVVACVGNDGIGKFLQSEIKRIGISGKYIQVSNEHPTSLVLVTRSKGTPDFIAYRLADTQLKNVSPGLIESAGILHTTAFALSRQPARATILTAFKLAKETGKTISVDWNFAPSIWGNDDGREVFETIMQLEPLMKVSLDDMERFAGINEVNHCLKFLDEYAGIICLSAGKDGVHFRNASMEWKHFPALPVAEVVDTTGAGDAFWAGFMSAYIDNFTMEECVKKGLSVAALKVQKHGPLYV